MKSDTKSIKANFAQAVPSEDLPPAIPEALGTCVVCGEGQAFPHASTLTLKGGMKVPILAQQCDHCGSIYAGHLECEANKAVVAAARSGSTEQPEDYWIRQHTAARLAEMEMRRQLEAAERDLEELRFYRKWGFPYTDHSTMFRKDHQGLYAITLPMSHPSPQGEGTVAGVVIRAFTVPELYAKAVQHIAAIDAASEARVEPIAGLHSAPLGPNKKNSAPESTAPESALSMTEEPKGTP